MEPAPANSGASPGEGHYVVVARRYRPQLFAELLGQEHVARALSGAITSNRVGHAYLFTGARGVGKTSAARILAKALNCARGMSPEPCGECDSCQSVAAGTDVDVLEIDGASNRGIDEIRELRQNVNVRPSRSRHKIYIIDEVHMLTREAFNALLKTLEEPPEHVKFIFCTTEAEKIPITILSRCQRFDFAGIQSGAIAARLGQIVAAEGVTAEPAALELLARRAGGSMRDSQSLLEQLLSFGSQHLTAADVHALLGTADDHRIAAIVGAIVERQPAAALGEIDAAAAAGVDLGRLLEQLLGFLRDALVLAVGGRAEALLHVAPGEAAQTVAQAAERFSPSTLLAGLEIVDHTLGRLRFSTQGRTLVEAAVIRLALLDDLEDLGDLVAELRDGVPPSQAAGPRPATSATGATGGATPARGPQPTGTSAPRGAAPSAALSGEAADSSSSYRTNGQRSPTAESTAANSADSVGAEPVAEGTAASSLPDLSAAGPEELWAAALAQLSEMARGQAARAERIERPSTERLVVSFPPRYTSCKSFLERGNYLASLEKALTSLARRPLKLELVLGTESAAPGGTGPVAAQPAPVRERGESHADHPLVRKVRDLFDARTVWVEAPRQPAGTTAEG